MRRLQKRHLGAILTALDADIVMRSEAAFNAEGERIDGDLPPEDRIDAEVPAMEEARDIVSEKLGLYQDSGETV